MPRSRWTRWRPFVLVLVVFPVLAYGLVTWLSDWEGLAGVDLPNLADSQDDGTGTDDGAGDPADDAAESPTTAPPPTSEEPVAPPPVVDPVRAVQVLNSTSTSGLASSGADRVEAAGFTEVSAANWAGEDVAASVVYYPGPDDVATAEAVAAALGITAIEESATVAPDGIVAVLASDYVR